MTERSLHIARNGDNLGRFPIGEVPALVKSGFLRTDDDYWESGMSDWKPLNQLYELRFPGESPDAWKRDAKSVMADAASLIAKGTKKLAESARHIAAQGNERSDEATRKLLTDFIPQLRTLALKQVETKPFLLSEPALANDSIMERTFESMYDQLPDAFGRVVGQEDFVTYCLGRRHELFAQDPAARPVIPEALPGPFRLSHIRLLVCEFENMFRFYKEKLSLGVKFHEEGIYAEFDTGSALLALFHREYMAEAMYISSPHDQAHFLQRPVLVLSVPDVDAMYVALRERGVEFLQEPTDRPSWGIRTIHLQDPEGNLLEINSPLHAG